MPICLSALRPCQYFIVRALSMMCLLHHNRSLSLCELVITLLPLTRSDLRKRILSCFFCLRGYRCGRFLTTDILIDQQLLNADTAIDDDILANHE